MDPIILTWLHVVAYGIFTVSLCAAGFFLADKGEK